MVVIEGVIAEVLNEEVDAREADGKEKPEEAGCIEALMPTFPEKSNKLLEG